MGYSQKLKAWLESISSVAVVLAAIAVIIAILLQHRPRYPEPVADTTNGSQVERYESNSKLLSLADARYQKTLLMALNVNCSFCKASIPFYKHIETTSGNNTKLLAVFPNTQAEAQRYMESAGLTFPFEAGVDYNKTGLLGTPTLLILDKKGRVIKSWVGQLSASQEGDVEKLLK